MNNSLSLWCLMKNAKSKGMKKNILLLACLIGMASCTDRKDLYNPDAGSKDNPLDMEVSKDFDWSMMTDLNVSVNVDDQYNGQYSYVVEVFDANPVISSDAVLLARGKAKKGEAYNVTLKVGKGLQTIYVKQTDPTKLTKTRAFTVEGASVYCDFTSNAGNRSLALRSISRAFVDMEEPSDDVFPGECPSGLGEFNSSSFKAGETYRVTAQTNAINLGEQEGITLYVAEDVTLASAMYLTQNSKIYILNGGKLTMPVSNNNGQSNCLISVGSGASLVVNGTLQLDSNYKLYNKGNVTATDFSCTNTSYLYNKGELNLQGTLTGTNGSSCILNVGALSAKGLSVTGDSHFENRGTATIEGTTTLNCTGGSWKNEGTYTTEDMNVSAWNDFTYNACKLVVNNKLSLGEAKMQVEGSVTTKDLEFRQSRVDLAGNAFFNVTGTATYQYNQLNSHGFFASSSARALLRLNEVKKDGSGTCMTYGGLLTIVYVSQDTPHPAKELDQWNPYWAEDATVEWADESDNKTNQVIPASTCNPGYSNTPSAPEEPEVEPAEGWTGIYAMEDNWPSYGDYDMNDVVVKTAVSMKLHNNGGYVKEADVEIWLMAVGANKTIAAAVQLDQITSDMLRTSGNYSVKHDELEDISAFSVVSNACHIEQGQAKVVIPLFASANQLLGGNYVNVGEGPSTQAKKIQVNLRFEDGKVTTAMLQDRNFNFFIMTNGVQKDRTEIHLRNFAITDLGNGSLSGKEDDNGNYTSHAGLVWGLLIPSSSWSWPEEHDNIKKVYPSFESWATSNGAQNPDWYSHPAQND